MKFTTEWLGELVSPLEAPEALCERLTMSGLEVEEVSSLDVPLESVVAARLLSVSTHPSADNLKVCEVDAGSHGVHKVVCGAPNARSGLTACLALTDSVIAGGVEVRTTAIRGVESRGMLCSAAELGLGDDNSGLLELPADVAPGTSMAALCPATDTLIELSLTPNRGDCLSLLGIAREFSALANVECREPVTPAVAPLSQATLPVTLVDSAACPVYAGRVLEDVDSSITTPLWMKERLRRCGVRSISIVVDVTNYVMLTLGQPMHAFDLDRLQAGIAVRRARVGERLTLLDGSEPELEASDLVITDGAGPVALAGVMGGLASGVQTGTRRVFLESAWFDPIQIAGTARRLRLHTDASHRFERGVDPTGQARAVELATRLLVDLCGARPGPLQWVSARDEAAVRPDPIRFRLNRANSLLGTSIDEHEAREIFRRLRLEVAEKDQHWHVTPPPWRPDLGREEDLVEELARVRGYDRIPVSSPTPALQLAFGDVARDDLGRLQDALVGAGYLEAITYSFISPELWHLFGEGLEPVALANPISREMGVMRPSLIPGLVSAALHNQHRQVAHQRLFETGMVFRRLQGQSTLVQENRVAGLATGQALSPQWSGVSRPVDFYDLKQDVINLLAVLGWRGAEFVPGAVPGLHPGACAQIRLAGKVVGHVGELHPAIIRSLDLAGTPVAFELALPQLAGSPRPAFEPFSRFPAVRRDLAVVVDEETPAGAVLALVSRAAGPLLRDLQLFDVYRGQGIDSGKKSLALGLLFQAPSSTLVDSQVETAVADILQQLSLELGASLRV